jgi:hypothetical protein
MNPLASSKCARRLLMALAAISGIFLTAGCGSSGSIQSLGGGFSKASLKGQYVIAQTGIGINQLLTSNDPFSETVVFTADGNGKLNVTLDDFDQDGALLNPTLPVTGTYSIASDGTGSLVVNYSVPSNYAITMIDDSHFYIIEQDLYATTSGFGEKQDTTQFAAAPSGAFVFKAHNLKTSSRVGGIAVAAGAVTGSEDLLILGSSPSSPSVTGSMGVPDSNGRGTFTLNDGTTFNYNYYVVGSGKFHFMSSSGTLEIGQAEAQVAPAGGFSLATLPAAASYVFGSSGDTSVSGTAGIHSAGVFTTDGAGNIEAGSSTVPGAVDYVQDSTVNSNLAVSGGTYTLDSSGHGEIDLTLSGASISPQIFWMVNGTSAYFLANNTAAVEDGTFSQQTGAPFTALTSQAAFFMDGFDVAYKDRVGAFKPTATSFTWNQAANSFDPSIPNGGVPTAIGTNGTYQVSSNGRATVVVNGVTASGVNPGVVFYLSSANTGFMVQEDVVGVDIGGAFSQQASQ